MVLTDIRHVYKPFHYPWAYEYWKKQQQVHWMPEEVPLADDVRDWEKKLTVSEKNLLTQIFRFFTQGDIEVNNCYMKKYSQMFGAPEVQMMLSAFSNMETIHIDAYSHLLDTLNIPEEEYAAFLEYDSMKAKFDYLQDVKSVTKEEIALTLAIFSAFTEGVSLFASFAILLNFPRFNKMKGMGQIITWSVRDETLHVEGMVKLFRTFIEENPEIWNDKLKGLIYQAGRDTVKMEFNFIDTAFEMGPIEGLTAQDVKDYVMHIADRRLLQLGLKPEFGVKDNPLPFVDEQLAAIEYGNFFEARVTEYSKSSLEGEWEEAYEQTDVYVMYGQEDCKFCGDTKGLLDNLVIDYTYVPVTDPMKQSMYNQTGHDSIPLVYKNGEFIGGYSELRKSITGA